MNLPWKKSSEKKGPKANAGGLSADFTLYHDGSNVLLSAENPTARRHLEENVAEYAQWLVRFYELDGSSFLLRKHGDSFFVKPGCVLATLADTLVKRGFVVVKEDKASPPSARSIPSNGSGAMKNIQGMAEPPADADFLVYYDGPKVLLRPQNSTAREYVQRNLAAHGQGCLGGALVIKAISVVPLTHKLLAAGFKVVGQTAIIQAGPQLYVHDGNWGLYTAGRAIPPKVVSRILKGAGRPN